MDDSIENRLHKCLAELVKHAQDNFDDYLSQGAIKQVQVSGEKISVKYDSFRGSFVNEIYTPIQKNILVKAGLTRFSEITRIIPGYFECVNRIKELYDIYLDQSYYQYIEGHLQDFLSKMVLAKNTGIDQERSIKLFIDELKNNAIDYNVVIFLYGARVKGILELGDISYYWGFKLREPRKEDLEVEVISDRFYGNHEKGHGFVTEGTTAIIEFRLHHDTNDHEFIGIDGEVKRLADILLLYKLGRVVCLKHAGYNIIDESIEEGPVYSDYSLSRTLDYSISEDETVKLKDFILALKPIVTQEKYRSVKENAQQELIMGRYKEALLAPFNVTFGHRISMLIIALEALYLKDSETRKRTSKMIKRAVGVLNEFGLNDIDIESNIESANGIRNHLLHGTPLTKSEEEEAARLYPIVSNYTRISIVIFLQLEKYYKKEDIINIINAGSLSPLKDKKICYNI